MSSSFTLKDWERENLLQKEPILPSTPSRYVPGDMITPCRLHVRAFRPICFYGDTEKFADMYEDISLEDQRDYLVLSYPFPYLSDQPVKILVGEEIWYVDGGDMSKSPRT